MSTMKKMMMSIASAVIIVLVGKAIILDEAVASYLISFFFVGAGLAGLRLFINMMYGSVLRKLTSDCNLLYKLLCKGSFSGSSMTRNAEDKFYIGILNPCKEFLCEVVHDGTSLISRFNELFLYSVNVKN